MRMLEKYFSPGITLVSVALQEYFQLFEGSRYYLPERRGYHAAEFQADLLRKMAAYCPLFLEKPKGKLIPNGKLPDWRFRQLHSPLYRFLRHCPPEGIGLFTAEVFWPPKPPPTVLRRQYCNYTLESALQEFQNLPPDGSITEYSVYRALFQQFQEECANIST